MIDTYGPTALTALRGCAMLDELGAHERRRLEHAAHVGQLIGRAHVFPDVRAMARQYFEGLLADPQVVNSTALIATTIEAIWPAAQFSYIPQGSATLGKMYEIKAFGTITYGTASTLIITPSIGTATGGATLGASAAVSCPVSVGPFPYFIHALAVVRSVTSPNAAAGSMMLGGVFISGGVLANTSPGANHIVPFGGTSAAFDTTAGPAGTTGAITIAKTLSVAGSMTHMAAAMQDLN